MSRFSVLVVCTRATFVRIVMQEMLAIYGEDLSQVGVITELATDTTIGPVCLSGIENAQSAINLTERDA